MILHIITIGLALSSFEGAFQRTETKSIPKDMQVSGEKGWTYWNYYAISPNGDRAVFIDPEKAAVYSYELAAGTPKVVSPHTDVAEFASFQTAEELESFDVGRLEKAVAEKGRHSDEVNLPISLSFTATGNLFISDAGNRRVLRYDSLGKWAGSFILPQPINPPSDIRELPDNNYLLAGLRLDSLSEINAGWYCNIVSSTGKLLQSFAYTPESAMRDNLWAGVSAMADCDIRGDIYVCFSTDPVIHKYSRSGQEFGSIGSIPDWWVAPPALSRPKFKRQNVPHDYFGSWTTPIKLCIVGDSLLIRTTETNGLIDGCDKPFIIDVFSTSGRTIASGIASDYFPVGYSPRGEIYFLSLKGDELIKARWKSR